MAMVLPGNSYLDISWLERNVEPLETGAELLNIDSSIAVLIQLVEQALQSLLTLHRQFVHVMELWLTVRYHSGDYQTRTALPVCMR